MEWGQIIGFAVVGVALIVLLRQYQPEYSALLSFGTGFLLLTIVAVKLTPVWDEIHQLVQKTGMAGEQTEVLIKSLGICFVTQLACEVCRDSGESAIATKVEFAGKAAILLLSLPLFRQLISIALQLIMGVPA